MSNYVPKPDEEGVNVPPSTPLRDALLLVAGFFGVVAAVTGGLVFGGGWLASRLSPEMEARLFSELKISLNHKGQRTLVAEDVFAPLLKRLAPNDDGLPVMVDVVCDSSPNAFAFPGGTIMVTSGLIRNLKSENGLAFVLGHELGHIRHRDHLTGIGRGFGLLIAASLLGLGGAEGIGLDVAQNVIGNSFNRHQESLADEYAADLLNHAYGNLAGAGEFFKFILESENSWQGRIPSFLSTHPNPKERLLVMAGRQKDQTGDLIPLSEGVRESVSHCGSK